MRRAPGLVAVASLAVALLARHAGAAEPAPYVFAVIPQAPPVVMFPSWDPLVERIAARAAVPLRLKLYGDMAEFERDVLAGGPDLVFTHPAMAVDAYRRQGYVPLVRDERQLRAFLFVRRDSPFERVRDLEGKSIAFVGGQNYCAVLVMALLARDRESIRFNSQQVGSSRNVLRAVLLGKAEAGASLDLSLEAESEEERRLVKVLLASPPTASHPVSAHPRVPAEVRSRIAAAILGMAKSDEDKELLARVHLANPAPADFERDYLPVERMR